MKFTTINTQNKQYDQVSAAELDTILAKSFDKPLGFLGFEKINQRKWVRANKTDIRELFSIFAMKGASYIPIWGFSLDYVPHISGSKVMWHRTNKSALFDYRHDPFDYENIDKFDLASWKIDSLYGKTNAIQQASEVAEISIHKAKTLWDSVQSPIDMIKIYEEQLQLTIEGKMNRFGFFNYTQHPIAYAFTLAKTGNQESANEMLEKAIQRDPHIQKSDDELRKRLLILSTNK